MRKNLNTILKLTILLWCPAAFPWGAPAHEAASDLAEPYISDRAREVINLLLADETLAEASTWADRMRSNPARFWQKEASPYHYVTVPPGYSYPEVGAPRKGDALQALDMFRADLESETVSLERKQLALRFALHIVQDLHQPLHVGNGEDRGGNDVAVTVDGERETFHWLWDSLLFREASLNRSGLVAAIQRGEALRAPIPGDESPLLWVEESGALRDRIYPPPTQLDEAYLNTYEPIARERLALAAVRSAAWLNDALENAYVPTAAAKNAANAAVETEQPTPWWKRLFGR